MRNKIFSLVIFIGLILQSFALAEDFNEWTQWSGDILNHHNKTPPEPKINAENVHNLKVKWMYKTKNSSVVATPTVKDNVVYFTEVAKISVGGLFSGGRLYAVDATTGKKIWTSKVESMTQSGLRNFSRSSPAIVGNKLIIGDSINNIKFIVKAITNGDLKKIPGTSVMAVDRYTGKLIWKTIVEEHFASRITMSPITYDGKIYVGVSSLESEIPAIRGEKYPCCTFRGSFVSLDAETGRILWKTKMISDSVKEFAGAPVWGGSPPIDVKRNRIYITSGNNYQATSEMMKCMKAERKNKIGEDEAVRRCAQLTDTPENRFDSILALDLATGRIIWTKKTNIYDAWNVGCGSSFTKFPKPNKSCPQPTGLDADFAQAPMLISTSINGKAMDIVVAGQKNGAFWALNAEDGSTVWQAQIGPRGKLGGHQWGSATDGERIYFQTTNLEHVSVTLEAGYEAGKTIQGGFWGALDVRTGKLIWETADPFTKYPLKGEKIDHVLYGKNLGRGYFASPMGPLTYYNGIIFSGSLGGQLLALDARDGRVLWQMLTKGSVVSAPSIVNDVLYWGTGYHMGFASKEMYALDLAQ